MSYKLLVFEPHIKSHPSSENVLWKGQVIPPSNYSSIMLVLLQDILELNNRRTISEWENILKDNLENNLKPNIDNNLKDNLEMNLKYNPMINLKDNLRII